MSSNGRYRRVLFSAIFLFCVSLVFSTACPLHKEDLSIIYESVDDGVSYGVISKDLIKLSEGDVGRGDSAKFLVMPCGSDLKEEIRCLSVHVHVTEFVNDEYLRSSVTI